MSDSKAWFSLGLLSHTVKNKHQGFLVLILPQFIFAKTKGWLKLAAKRTELSKVQQCCNPVVFTPKDVTDISFRPQECV